MLGHRHPLPVASRLVGLGLSAAVTLSAFAGCSADRAVYPSTEFRPARVEVVDTLNDETLWVMDVPPGQKLVIDFDRRSGLNKEWEAWEAPADAPTNLEWRLYPLKARKLFTSGYYMGSPLNEGSVDLGGVPVMVNLQTLPRESGPPVAEPMAPETTPQPAADPDTAEQDDASPQDAAADADADTTAQAPARSGDAVEAHEAGSEGPEADTDAMSETK